MQRSERLNQASENIIFESPVIEVAAQPIEVTPDIMDIPGTPHEKLLALSEMI